MGEKQLNADDARAIASAYVNEAGGEIQILDTETLERPFGWVFFYQSTQYLETKSLSDMLVGNAPILVDRFTGETHVAGTAQPVEHYIANYEETGDLHRSGDTGG